LAQKQALPEAVQWSLQPIADTLANPMINVVRFPVEIFYSRCGHGGLAFELLEQPSVFLSTSIGCLAQGLRCGGRNIFAFPKPARCVLEAAGLRAPN